MNIKDLITKPHIDKVVDPSAGDVATSVSTSLPSTIAAYSQSIASTPVLVKVQDIVAQADLTVTGITQNIQGIVRDNSTDPNVVAYNDLLQQNYYDPANYLNKVAPTEISYNTLIDVGRTVYRTSNDVRGILYEILQEASILKMVFDQVWNKTLGGKKLGNLLGEPSILSYFFYKSRYNLNYFSSLGDYIQNMATPVPNPSFVSYLNGMFLNHNNLTDPALSMPDIAHTVGTALTDELLHDNHDFEHYTQVATDHKKDIMGYIGNQFSLGVSLGVVSGLYPKFNSIMGQIEGPLQKDFNSQGELSVFKGSIDRAFNRQIQRVEQGLLDMERQFQHQKSSNELRVALALKSKHNQVHAQLTQDQINSIAQGLTGIF